MRNRKAISLDGGADKTPGQTKIFHTCRYIPFNFLTSKGQCRENTGFKLESHTYQQPNCKIQHVRISREENTLQPEIKSE
jgi:hypothetical protein